MTGFDQLEHELLAAARRLARAGRVRPWLRSRRWVPGADRVATATAVSVAVAIVAGALVSLHHRPASAPAARPTPSGVRRLVAELAVLRSPQTAAARRWLRGEDARRLARTPARFGVLPGLTRAVSLPDHEQLILYVIGSSRFDLTGLGYMERGRLSGFGACCITANELTRPTGPGPLASQSGRIPPQVYFEIVPDGVSRVRWTFARRGNFRFADPGRRHLKRMGRFVAPSFIGAPNSAPLTMTIAVHDNVAAMKLPNRGAAITDIWLNATGRIIAHRGHR
jgi:hypothetical protein